MTRKNRYYTQLDTETIHTKQEFKSMLHPENIVKRYRQQYGTEPDFTITDKTGQPVDITAVQEMTMQDRLNKLIIAEQSWLSIPALIRRKEFDNNPQNFINALADQNQHENLVKLGLMQYKEPTKDIYEETKKINDNLEKLSNNLSKPVAGSSFS